MIGSVLSTAWFPAGASTYAPRMDGAFTGITVLAACALVGVAGLAVVFLGIYRRRAGDPDRMPSGATNPFVLGAGVLAAILLAAFAFRASLSAFVDEDVAPYGAYAVGVHARQGAWDFTYPNGHVADTLRVAVGQPVALTMTTADVPQNLSIPALRVDRAILPGRTTRAWFETTLPDTFPIYTGAFSAATQDSFDSALISLTPEQFQAWLASVEDIFKGRTLPEVGELLYKKMGCVACHTLDGSKLVGPSFKNVYGHEFATEEGKTITANDAYIKESILTPNASVIKGYQPVMIPFAGRLDDREIGAITAFLKTLSDRGGTGAAAADSTAGKE